MAVSFPSAISQIVRKSSTRNELVITSILTLSLFVGPYLLSAGSHSLSELGIEKGVGGTEFTIGHRFSLIGFVVSAHGGPDRQYRHLSVSELEATTKEMPSILFLTGYQDAVDRFGEIAFFIAYVPELKKTRLFMGPSDIVKHREANLWRIRVQNEHGDRFGKFVIVSARLIY